MPIRPAPRTFTCHTCHWSKTVAPRSDALAPGEHFTVCPACGHSPLQSRLANMSEAAWGSVTEQVKRFFR